MMGQAYLAGSDPQIMTRTWQDAFAAIIASKPDGSETQHRWTTASRDDALRPLLKVPLPRTAPEQMLKALKRGTVGTNVYLRRAQNFACDLGWLPWPILRKQQFPKVRYKPKRGITEDEHRRILAREPDPERRDFYELCWLLGGSQGDIARLTDGDIDRDDRLVCYHRKEDAPADAG